MGPKQAVMEKASEAGEKGRDRRRDQGDDLG